jgi:hypothetical protein
MGAALDFPDHKSVQRIFSDHPRAADHRRDHMVHEPLLRKFRLGVADGRFAQRPEFELLAVSP